MCRCGCPKQAELCFPCIGASPSSSVENFKVLLCTLKGGPENTLFLYFFLLETNKIE